MQDPRPGVSVILTSYNYGHFLQRAIESVLSQDATGFELVIVDNASTDDSWDVIKSAAERDPRVRAFRNDTNIGMVRNHNRGLELARGTRVLFLSADDYLLPGHLSRLMSAHAQHPDVDLLFTSYVKVNEREEFLEFIGHSGHLRGSYFGGRNEFADLLTHDCYACTPTTLWEREELLAGGGFDDGLIAGDLDLYLRMAARGKRFGFIDTAGVCVRIHPGELTGEKNYVSTGRQLLDHLYLLDRYLVPANAELLYGREHGVARLLNAKINNLRGYPDTAQRILPQEQNRIDSLAKRLSGFLSTSLAGSGSLAARISVILLCGDDFQAALETISMVDRQKYENTELILATGSARDAAPLLLDRAKTLQTRAVHHRASIKRALSLNDALRLANGEIVTYCEPGAEWPEGHLRRIAQHFAKSRIDALAVPADLVVRRGGVPVARYANFAGSPIAGSAATIGEAVPLSAFSHRRRTIDQFGAFEERLAHAADFEFVRRLFVHTAVGLDQNAPVTLNKNVDDVHPALSDPNGYLASLRAIYASQPMDAMVQARTEVHLQTLQGAFSKAAASAGAGGLFRFWSDVRGMEPVQIAGTGFSGRPRILMVDDRVPYRELGRGYPRAREVLEVLAKVADVTFYPLMTPFDQAPLTSGAAGVDILYGRGTQLLASTLEEALPNTDILWVSRPHNLELVRAALGGIPAERPWKLVYDAEAIYAHREIAKAALSGRPLDAAARSEMLEREFALLDGCDRIFAVSRGDRAEIAQRSACPVETLSFSLAPTPRAAAFQERDGLLFVGAIEPASPNEDALAWFAAHVVPLVRNQYPNLRVRHAGVLASHALAAQIGSAVEFLGIVPDLAQTYSDARIFIAPTRYAAGVPQKVYEAAANGLPVIATSLLSRQLGWQHEREILVADTPAEWATAVARLNEDAELWNALRERALDAVRREVAPKVFEQGIAAAVAALTAQPVSF